MKNDVARDISYATSTDGLLGQLLIRSIENVTGRIGLIKRAKDYDKEVANGRNFWDCLLYTSPSPRDATLSRMPSSA